MTRGGLTNAALLVAVAALAAFVAYNPRGESPDDYRLSRLQANAVRHVRLERKGDPAIALERKEDGWFIVAPLAARADPFQVDRLLAILGATAAHRFPAQDLARFNLDQPFARVTVDGEHLSYGAINAVTQEQYVLAGGSVYALPARYGAMLPANLSQLIGKQLLNSTESPVQFQFRDFTIVRDAGGWRVSPARGDLSQDDIHRWVDAWRHAAALRAEPYADGEAVDTIRVELQNGKQLTLDVLQTAPEVVIGRRDVKLRYHFAARAAKRLLTPPGAER